VGAPDAARAAALNKEERDALPSEQVIERLKQGNERFRGGKMQNHDYLAQKRASGRWSVPGSSDSQLY
jgi:carbonic anhydrase